MNIMQESKIILLDQLVVEPKSLVLPDGILPVVAKTAEQVDAITPLPFDERFKDQNSRDKAITQLRIRLTFANTALCAVSLLALNTLNLLPEIPSIAAFKLASEPMLFFPWGFIFCLISFLALFFYLVHARGDLSDLKNDKEVSEYGYKAIAAVVERMPVIKDYVTKQIAETGMISQIDLRYMRIDDQLGEIVGVGIDKKRQEEKAQERKSLEASKQQVLEKL